MISDLLAQCDLKGADSWTIACDDCRNILISFSGGRTSALMSKLVKKHPWFADKNVHFVFANTGKERPETLDFVDRCDREFELGLTWVEAVVNPETGCGTEFREVAYATASRNGEPFEEVIKKYGIPNQMFRHCSRELKFHPMKKWAQWKFAGQPYITALGIRFDEPRRIKRKSGYIWPMWDWELTVNHVRQFWNSHHFDLQLKDYEGNCDACWKKSDRKLLTLCRERPDLFKWWSDMESRYADIDIRERKANGTSFFRHNRSALDLLELSSKPFELVTDPLFDAEEACACFRGEEME